jgi:hypothetical protein
MKRVLIAALAMLTIVAGAVAANKPAATDKPNFSGEWTMNAAKSNFGQLPAPVKFVRKIKHSEPSLVVIEEQTAGGRDSTTTRKITTDGKLLTSKVQITTPQGDADLIIVFDRQ